MENYTGNCKARPLRSQRNGRIRCVLSARTLSYDVEVLSRYALLADDDPSSVYTHQTPSIPEDLEERRG